MLVRYADWKKPTDGAYAFRLRAGLVPALPAPGARSDVRDVAREALEDGEAERFARAVTRWGGPEDVGPDGTRPYAPVQTAFVEAGWGPVTDADVDAVLRGEVRVLRGPGGRADYVLRDHHTLDVVLYHYRTTGGLPRALLHADRHSDWCRDGLLERRVPQQAATWWKLLEGLKRPGDGGPVLREEDVHFTTAVGARTARTSGRDVGVEARVPWFVDAGALGWEQVLARPEALAADWLSLDLDYFQPAPQLRAVRGLVRDARFQRLSAEARVRLYVLSPQFTNGGDLVEPWTVQGSRTASRRLVNLLRALPEGLRP